MANPTKLFGWVTPHVAQIIHDVPAFRENLFTMSDGDWHHFAMLLSLMGKRAEDPEMLSTFAVDFFRKKKKNLLKEISPNAPTNVLKLTSKFKGRFWAPATYRRVVTLAREANAAKVLAHKDSIGREHIFWLSRLPVPYRQTGVLNKMNSTHQVRELIFAIDVVKQVRGDMSDREIAISLADSKKLSVQRWTANHFRQIAFPAPPWAGSAEIKPLTSFKELKESALRFENCIRTYLVKVLRGTSYFYRYDENGKPVAIVEIVNLPVLGWAVNEALGRDNDELSGRHMSHVMQTFRQAGLKTAPPSIAPENWLSPWE